MDIKTRTEIVNVGTIIDIGKIVQELKNQNKEETLPCLITIISLMTAIARTIQNYPNLGIKKKVLELIDETNELAQHELNPEDFQELKRLGNWVSSFLTE